MNYSAEVGINDTIQPEGYPGDPDFSLKNSASGKYVPGGPMYQFSRKDIPPMVRWSESGSITSEIFANVLKTLDIYDLLVTFIYNCYNWCQCLPKNAKY